MRKGDLLFGWLFAGSLVVSLVVSRVARADEDCSGAAVADACAQAHKAWWDVCQGTKADFDGNSPQSMNEWTERAKRLDDVVAQMKKFDASYGSCFWENPDCNFSKSDLDKCMEAPAAYQERWKARIAWTTKTTLGQSLSRAQTFKGRKDAVGYGEAIRDLQGAIATAEADLARNQIAAIHVDAKALEEAVAQAKHVAGETKGQLKAQIASARCPAAKFQNDALLETLRGLADETRRAQTAGTDLKVSTVTFRFISKPWQEVLDHPRRTLEFVSTGACERQVRGSEAKCRVMEMKFRRVRTGEGPWSGWTLDATGGGDEVLCENVNK